MRSDYCYGSHVSNLPQSAFFTQAKVFTPRKSIIFPAGGGGGVESPNEFPRNYHEQIGWLTPQMISGKCRLLAIICHILFPAGFPAIFLCVPRYSWKRFLNGSPLLIFLVFRLGLFSLARVMLPTPSHVAICKKWGLLYNQVFVL